jgi:hypothetical protein
VLVCRDPDDPDVAMTSRPRAPAARDRSLHAIPSGTGRITFEIAQGDQQDAIMFGFCVE